MAFEMVNKDVSIEFINDLDICIGIIVNLTSNTDHSIVMFDALLSGKVESLCFSDLTNKVRLLVYEGIPKVDLKNNITITLSKHHIEVLKDMLLDVSIGGGFVGYHYDIELFYDKPLDVCFLLK